MTCVHHTWQVYMVFSGFASTLPTASKAPLRPLTALWLLLQGVAYRNCFRIIIGGSKKLLEIPRIVCTVFVSAVL
jgi:hypothetical protein